jgi:Bacterial membrane protein YfhO
MGHVIPGEQHQQYMATRRRAFTPEAANVPRLTADPDLVTEEAGRGYVEKTFYLSDYNPLRLRRYQYLLDAGFTDWLTNGPRVVALPPGSQPWTYETFQPLVSPVDYQILTYQPNQVSYQVRAEHDALLVFNEIFFPGWRATVDGQRATVTPVSGGLRGVQVAAGAHTIVLSFQPNSFYVGVAVSLVSAALFLLWCSLIFYAARRAHKIKERQLAAATT